MYALDCSAAIGFGLNPLDRLPDRREDEAFVQAARRDVRSRFFVFAGEVPVLKRTDAGRDALFCAHEIPVLGEPCQEVFLGKEADGRALFAIDVGQDRGDALAALPGIELIDLRTIAMRGMFPHALTGELGGAKAILHWHQRHRFCANCGAASGVAAAGWRRDCTACGAQHFPRVDPVVIMVAVDGERCLLGRQRRFAPGMYSALAGFLEPGETVEDAVRREILEEAGVRCAQVRYYASQPWPFPSSLMIGCFARAVSIDIAVDEAELEDARWFARAEVAQMLDGSHPDGLSTPKPFAIAHHLLKAYVEHGEGVLLDRAAAG